MRTQNIQFPSNDQQGAGYLARPDSDEPKPGVVVIQEWWGLNAHIRDVTERFAKEGFVALAPDLYHGKVVAEPNDAQKAAMELDRSRAIQEIDGAVAYLEAQPYVSPKQIGVIGFCMGGGLALHTTAHNPDVSAVAAFYGGGSPSADAFAQSRAAVLNIVGERDVRVAATIKELDAGLKRYGTPHELIIYPGAEHAFFNDTRKEVYKPDAAQDAWNRALSWFRQYLV
ncbi:MAG: dienelactone hydrolase family protein [Anaerolineae bacterium]|nr:dienelactone hydrolase family protein [Anaerolineae bacterium]